MMMMMIKQDPDQCLRESQAYGIGQKVAVSMSNESTCEKAHKYKASQVQTG